MGTYDSDIARSMSLAELKAMMRTAGVRKLYCKHLSPNDNSKNQPYFGPDLSSINIIPTGSITAETTRSTKLDAPGKKILKAAVELQWLTTSGHLLLAPNTKIIHYPQFPESRFSGFLSGSAVDMSEWMDPAKQGRHPERYLFLGVTDSRKVIGFLSVPGSTISKEMELQKDFLEKVGVFLDVPVVASVDYRHELLVHLKEIAEKGWVHSIRLSQDGLIPCNSTNCGGYTLEALLGISPNGYSEPDFLGWEVKQYSVKNFSLLNSSVITLMTPEPNGGLYVSAGVESFIRKYGYPDTQGRPDRMNFGGVHKFSRKDPRTNLTLELIGFDAATGRITDPEGGIALLDGSGEVAALWGYTKLIDHWKRKHNRAVYIPSMLKQNGTRQYKYGLSVKLCTGTDFLHVLTGIQERSIYYDPGIKLESASVEPKIKRRSQFRIKSRDIDTLYSHVEIVNLESIG